MIPGVAGEGHNRKGEEVGQGCHWMEEVGDELEVGKGSGWLDREGECRMGRSRLRPVRHSFVLQQKQMHKTFIYSTGLQDNLITFIA